MAKYNGPLLDRAAIIKGTSLWNFVPKSGLKNFATAHRPSKVLSA